MQIPDEGGSPTPARCRETQRTTPTTTRHLSSGLNIYPGGASLLFALLLLSLGVWYGAVGSISVEKVRSPRVEMFYWTAIMFSQTLGTALGDWMADTNGLGYERSSLVFGAALALIAGAYFFTKISRTFLSGRRESMREPGQGPGDSRHALLADIDKSRMSD